MKRFATGSPDTLLNKIRDIPSLPEVVNRIIQLLGKPNTPASEIAQLIAYDPGLTSKVLRMVNSAAYGFQRQISSVQHAIMILGFNTIRGLVLSASIFKLFEKQGNTNALDQREIWEHSIITAMTARVIATHLRLPEADDAFSAGMLHDVGKMVLDVHFNQDYIRVLKAAQGTFHGETFSELEREILGTTHAEVGSFLANKWKLPISISQVIEYHHTPEKATSCESLVYLIALANELSSVVYMSEEAFQLDSIRPDVVAYFRLSEGELGHIVQLLREELSGQEEFIDIFSVI